MSELNTTDFLDPMVFQRWTNGRHLVRCLKVIAETHDVTTFTFNMNHPVLFLYKPGQFVTLELEIDGERVMRSYTISSSPSIPYSFSITVKRAPGGRVSNWLHDNLRSGDQIAIHGPVGRFNCMDFPSDKVLLLSGGVGITPMMSMARWWFDTDSSVDMVFAHSARTPKDVIYSHELAYMSTRIDTFKLHLICEKTEIGQAWNGYRGYLDIHMLKLIAEDYQDREIFCCGPVPYMTAVKKMLEESGFDMRRYHEESFDATPAKDVALAEKHANMAEIQDQQPKELVSLSFVDSDETIEVDRGMNLNEAAISAGVNISKACGIGICGACRVKVISGEFDMLHSGGISDEEIEDGYILSCCTSIQSDMKIEY